MIDRARHRRVPPLTDEVCDEILTATLTQPPAELGSRAGVAGIEIETSYTAVSTLNLSRWSAQRG